MSLTAKFNELTSEQQEAFKEIKSAEALDKFIADNNITLTDEEKSSVVEYIETGMMPLSDDDMGAVTGGKGSSTPDYAQMARNSGYHFRINKYSSSTAAKCPSCGTAGAMFSQNSFVRRQTSTYSYDEYIKTRCFKCNLGSTGVTNSVDTRSNGDIVFYFMISSGQPGNTVRGRA